jgi:hypothetical protein
MKSQISISGQAVSMRRAANQVKPFHRQKTDSHTRRPGIVSGRYDDPVTVKRLGNTDHGAAPRNDEDPPGGRAVLVEGSYCAIWEEPSALSAHLNCRRQRRPTGFCHQAWLGAKATVGQSLFARPCDAACVDNGPARLCHCGRRGRSFRQRGVGDSLYAIGCDPGQRVGASSIRAACTA